MKIFEHTQIKQAIDLTSDLEALIHCQKYAFMDFSSNLYDVPMPMQFVFPDTQSDCHIKASHKLGSKNLIIKIANGGPFGNTGMILVFASDTGILKAILRDEGFLTTLRTAIAGLIVSELIPWEINQIGIMGSGHLAKMLYHLLRLTYANKQIMLYARNHLKAKDITENTCYSSEKLVKKCDLIFTATASQKPLIQNINHHTHQAIIALGSDDPHKRELSLDLFAKSDMIIVDSKQQALKLGDVAKAISSGFVSADSVIELGTILQSGILKNAKTIIADFSGIAAQDVAITEFILNRLL